MLLYLVLRCKRYSYVKTYSVFEILVMRDLSMVSVFNDLFKTSFSAHFRFFEIWNEIISFLTKKHFFHKLIHTPVNLSAIICLFKLNNRNIRKKWEIYLKLAIKTQEKHQWRRSDIFIANVVHISHFYLVFFFSWRWTGKWLQECKLNVLI